MINEAWCKIIDRIKRNSDILMLLCTIFGGILYFSIMTTVSLGGDDCVNIPGYYTIFEENYWNIWIIWFDNLLKSFTFQATRFFPFDFPSIIIQVIFFKNIFMYRMFIIALTYADILLLGMLISKILGNDKIGKIFISIAPLWFCIWYQPANNGLYSYVGLPQSTLLPMLLAGILTIKWWENGRKLKKMWLPMFLTFYSCGTYELGFVLGITIIILLAYKITNLREWIKISIPIVVGETFCFLINVIYWTKAKGNVYEGVQVGINVKNILRCLKYQLAAGLPLNTMWASKVPYENIKVQDFIIVLIIACSACYFIYSISELDNKKLMIVLCGGLSLTFFPALIVAVSSKYQQECWVNSGQGYIPAVVESMGVGVVVTVIIVKLVLFFKKRNRIIYHLLLLIFLCGLIVLGTYQRAAVRNSWSAGGVVYNYLGNSLSDLFDGVKDEDLVVGYFPVWGDSDDAHSTLINRYTDISPDTKYYGNFRVEDLEHYDNAYAYGEGYYQQGEVPYIWIGEIAKNTYNGNCLLNNIKIYFPKEVYDEFWFVKYHFLSEQGEICEKEVKLEDARTEELASNVVLYLGEDDSIFDFSIRNSFWEASEFVKSIFDKFNYHYKKDELRQLSYGILKEEKESYWELFEIINKGNIDNTNFINSMYSDVLQRAPSEEELLGWVSNMEENALTREMVYELFITCDEFNNMRGW